MKILILNCTMNSQTIQGKRKMKKIAIVKLRMIMLVRMLYRRSNHTRKLLWPLKMYYFYNIKETLKKL